MDFISLVYTLRAAPTTSSCPAPYWWGRAVQALFLQTLAQDEPGLADSLHNNNGIHPYTVSSLLGRFPGGLIDPSQMYTLRLTAFNPALARRLDQCSEPGGSLGPGSQIELDWQKFIIESAVCQNHPWAGQGQYSDLAAHVLATSNPPPRHISLHWFSPTLFRQNGHDQPLPLPEWVFGSLLDRWNAFSPIAFPKDVRRYAAECIGLSRYALKARTIEVKEGAPRTGAIGDVTFFTYNYDRYWMSVLYTLAIFSRYSGIGAGTSMGMGQCCLIQEEAKGKTKMVAEL